MINIKTKYWPFPGTFISSDPKVELAKAATQARLNIVHIFDETDHHGGMTIVFRKTTEHKSGDMIEFAVANCSQEDAFSKKIGARIATENFLAGRTTQLPILRNLDKTDINGSVKQFFYVNWFKYLR